MSELTRIEEKMKSSFSGAAGDLKMERSFMTIRDEGGE